MPARQGATSTAERGGVSVVASATGRVAIAAGPAEATGWDESRPPLYRLDAALHCDSPLLRCMAEAIRLVAVTVEAAHVWSYCLDRRLQIGPVVVASHDRLATLAEELGAYVRAYNLVDPFSPPAFTKLRRVLISSRDLGGPEEFMRTRYARDFLQPRGFGHKAAFCLRRNGRIAARLALRRRLGQPDFSDSELTILRRIQPVVERALERTPEVGDGPETIATLTRREAEVAALVVEGATNAEIARALFIGTPTVKTHLTRIFTKLGVRSRTELALLISRGGAR